MDLFLRKLKVSRWLREEESGSTMIMMVSSTIPVNSSSFIWENSLILIRSPRPRLQWPQHLHQVHRHPLVFSNSYWTLCGLLGIFLLVWSKSSFERRALAENNPLKNHFRLCCILASARMDCHGCFKNINLTHVDLPYSVMLKGEIMRNHDYSPHTLKGHTSFRAKLSCFPTRTNLNIMLFL